jgi:hypothetical protein
VLVDTDYQHIFSIFNEITDHREDQGCLGRPWRAHQVKNVPTSQAATQKVVDWRTTAEDVIGGIQQRGSGLSRRWSRACRQDLLRRLDRYP